MQPSVTATIIIGVALLVCAIRSNDRYDARRPSGIDAFVKARLADTQRAVRRDKSSAELTRRILEQCGAIHGIVDAYRCAPEGPRADGLLTALRLHAAVWADHADYDPRWQVEHAHGPRVAGLPPPIGLGDDLSTQSLEELESRGNALLAEMRAIRRPEES